MKKSVFFGIFLAMVLSLFVTNFSSNVYAAEKVIAGEVSEPTVDGADVILPDRLMKTIATYNGNNVNNRFHKGNPWGHEIRKEGPNWRAVGAAGQLFHPYIGDPNTNYDPMNNFVKLEDIWPSDAFNPKESKFIAEIGGRICIQVPKSQNK